MVGLFLMAVISRYLASQDARPHCPLVAIAIAPHPRAAHLELARFAGGQAVVPRGYFKNGDLAAFLPEGALLPDYLLKRLALWDHTTGYGMLRGAGRNRVTLRKVHGELSHGVLVKGLRRPYDRDAACALLFGASGGWEGAAVIDEGKCCARLLQVH